MTNQTPSAKLARGEVIRVATNSLAYLVLADKKETILPFTPNVVAGYNGGDFEDLAITHDALVDVSCRPEDGIVDLVVPLRRLSMRSSHDRNTYSDLPHPKIDQLQRSPQLVLHPDQEARSDAVVRRAISRETRSFGKLIDCSVLQPGDLLLSQDLKPDRISDLIVKVQLHGGYAETDAQWSHAAAYLGDGENVVEATFESLFSPGSVRITSLDEYCQGNYALRFRRSSYVNSTEAGWRLCVRALSRLRQSYDFAQAARLWWDVMIRETGFYDGRNRRTTSEAVICSTLYAEAHNEATSGLLGEIGGACVPAFLSVTDKLRDLKVSWARIC